MGVARERADAGSFLPVWVRHEHAARYEFAARFVAGKNVVDCACGDGTGSATFARAGATMVHALDASKEAVAHAADVFAAPNIDFKHGDATALPFPDKMADVYISLETIEHIPQDADYLREAVRVLKPEGVFICSTPNRDVTNPGTSLANKPWNPFHVREYNSVEFDALLRQYFGEIEMFGQNPRSTLRVGCVQLFGRLMPFHGAVRFNQFCKLPRLLFDKLQHHRVMSNKDAACFEYYVAVCKNPLRSF
jgi:ubiquinone/menaquinone biosynthesis C-methylase UbiE